MFKWINQKYFIHHSLIFIGNENDKLENMIYYYPGGFKYGIDVKSISNGNRCVVAREDIKVR